MIQIINPDLFETRITQKDTSKNKYAGGGYQLDIFTKRSKGDKKSAPILRAFFDTENEAKNMTPDDDSRSGGTKLKSTLKTNANGKEVIQAKVTKCATGWQESIAIVAIPFRGSISGVVAGEHFDVIKGLIKNVDSFRSKATGKTYTKILYLVLRCDHYGTKFENSLCDAIREGRIKENINVCTVKSDVVSKNSKTGLSTLKTNSYSVDINLQHNADLELSFIPGDEHEGLNEEQLESLAPRVQFADIMDICKANVDAVVSASK